MDATVTVAPDKTGQTVTVERSPSGSWTSQTTAALGPGSTVTVPVCLGWVFLGTVPLRATWASDGVDGDGVSPTVDLSVVRAPWMRHIDSLVSGRSMSVSIADAGLFVYRRADTVARAPASNEKLLASMALLGRFGPDFEITTSASAAVVSNGVVQGNLWILGRGDPTMTSARLTILADHVKASGIVRITGSVIGSLGYFAHDWYAPGWHPDFPRIEVALPTALTVNGNISNGVHISDPERRAAVAVTKRLRAIGVQIGGAPRAGSPQVPLKAIATIHSAPMRELLRQMDVVSSNFDAETLGKLLGAVRSGAPGTIAKGAADIRAFASANGVNVASFDSSGLSYANRISPLGMVTLLRDVESTPWIEALRLALPHAGEGTLTGRLAGVRIRAKTGTLTKISALSGWVWVTREGRWAEFSILSSGGTPRLKRIEDAIVRTVAGHAP